MKTACEIDLSDPVPTFAAETDAAKIARLESANAVQLKLAVTAGLLKDHTARGPVPEWLTIKKAAFRSRSSDERMRQMAGTKAETLLHTHCAPSVAHSDIRQARKLASIICTSEAAIDAYVKFSSEEP